MIEKCDPVVREMHTVNGLFAELRAGGGCRRHEAEELLIQHLTQPNGALAGEVELDHCKNCKKKREEHFLEGGGETKIPFCNPDTGCIEPASVVYFAPKVVTLASQTPLAGSTIGFDKAWLKEHMPKLAALFSYRSVDVSSITELAKRWAPAVYEGRPKAGAAHRALADVRESIAILKYYRDRGFVGGGNWA